MVRGCRKDIGLGPVDRVSLAQARKVAFGNRNVARDGGDPTDTAAERTIPTFGEAFRGGCSRSRVQDGSGAGKSEGQWRATYRDYMGALASMPVNEIRTEHVLAALSPIWHDKHETARRTKQRIGEVMEWAAAHGYRDDNPADRAGRLLKKNGHLRKHFRALPYDAVQAALATVQASRAWVGTKGAFAFLVYTAARSGEVRGATWAEVDLDAATWTIPGERMKAGREHRVPLSDAALAVLREALRYRDDSGLIFPSVTGREMSDMTVSKLIRELGVDAVPHGMRSSFRQWAAERTNVPREVCEMALAHVNQDRVEAAYQRGDLFDRRRELMARWAAYLAREQGATVVQNEGLRSARR